MRSDGIFKVLLNYRTNDMIDLKRPAAQDKSLIFGIVEHGEPTTFLIRVLALAKSNYSSSSLLRLSKSYLIASALSKRFLPRCRHKIT